MKSRPGTRPRPASSSTPAARTRHDERDHDGRAAHDPDTGPDAWIRELVDAAPPLTRQQRHTLALLLNSPGPVPGRPAGAAAPDQVP
jgi:hypothetical protein